MAAAVPVVGSVEGVGFQSLEEHLRPAQVAQRLNVGARQVQRWIAEGEATRGKRGIHPVRRVGRRCVLVPASAVDNFLRRGK